MNEFMGLLTWLSERLVAPEPVPALAEEACEAELVRLDEVAVERLLEVEPAELRLLQLRLLLVELDGLELSEDKDELDMMLELVVACEKSELELDDSELASWTELAPEIDEEEDMEADEELAGSKRCEPMELPRRTANMLLVSIGVGYSCACIWLLALGWPAASSPGGCWAGTGWLGCCLCGLVVASVRAFVCVCVRASVVMLLML